MIINGDYHTDGLFCSQFFIHIKGGNDFMQSLHKDWFVESQGQVFEADLEELKQWIAEGAVLPSDRVKRGNLRWLAVEKVPELYSFVNSDGFQVASPVIATTNISRFENEDFQTQFAFGNSPDEAVLPAEAEKVCYSHRDVEAVLACDVCKNFFCKTCPNTYGTVKVCSLCSGLCRPIDEATDIHKSIGAINKPYVKIEADIHASGKPNQSPSRLSIAKQKTSKRSHLALILAAVLFSLILGAAYFILLLLK